MPTTIRLKSGIVLEVKEDVMYIEAMFEARKQDKLHVVNRLIKAHNVHNNEVFLIPKRQILLISWKEDSPVQPVQKRPSGPVFVPPT